MFRAHSTVAPRTRVFALDLTGASLALFVVVITGGCGQKGPLKLPEPLPAAASAQQPASAASATFTPNASPASSATQ